MPIAGTRFNPTKILVPTDFSISSLAALAAATDLALLFHAEVLLMHVMPVLPIVSGDDLPTPFPERQEFLRVAEEEAQETLTQWVSDLSGRGIEASLKVTVSNDVVDKVISTIEQQGINMLVLSTHGMSGWRPMVFGSIAEKLIKLAGCPVLLLRSAATPA